MMVVVVRMTTGQLRKGARCAGIDRATWLSRRSKSVARSPGHFRVRIAGLHLASLQRERGDYVRRCFERHERANRHVNTRERHARALILF